MFEFCLKLFDVKSITISICIHLLVCCLFLYSCNPRRVRNEPDSRLNLNSVSNDDFLEIIDSVSTNDSLLFPQTPDKYPSQILMRIAYATSYNTDTKNPNWVSWHLTREHLQGNYSRKGMPYQGANGEVLGVGYVGPEHQSGSFFVDMQANLPRADGDDWRMHPENVNHGHICPAGDNKWCKPATNQSFLLTNVCPQHPALNNGVWKSIEEKCRTWAKRYDDIYIIAGPIFKDNYHTFGVHEVGVPDYFFKVVLCLSGEPKTIAFLCPNDICDYSMESYVVSVDSVELVTRFDFFNVLPDSLESIIESESNITLW